MRMRFLTTLRSKERNKFDWHWREHMVWLENSYPPEKAKQRYDIEKAAAIFKTLVELERIQVEVDDSPGALDIVIEFSLTHLDAKLTGRKP